MGSPGFARHGGHDGCRPEALAHRFAAHLGFKLRSVDLSRDIDSETAHAILIGVAKHAGHERACVVACAVGHEGTMRMRAMLIDAYGGPETLRAADIARPLPGEGEALIRVEAIGVNPADTKWRAGMFSGLAPLRFPHVLGYDIVGTVVEVPSGGPLVIGARVAGMLHALRQGAYAEYATVATSSLALVPEGLAAEAAACVPTPGLTGVQIIEEHLDAQSGERVLITGALGGVGRFAVHAAKARGARVIAAVRASQRDLAMRLGVDEVVALGEESWRGGPIEKLADTIGGAEMAELCRFVPSSGRISTAATTPIPTDGLAVQPVFFAVRADGARLALLLDDVACGKIDYPIAKILPLTEAAEAHRLVEQGGAGGKIILRP